MPKSVFSPGYERFRHLLIRARKDAGLTQVELAARLSRHQSFVSKYENRERRLDLIEFLDVANALQLDPIEFIQELQRQIATIPVGNDRAV